LYNLFDIEAIQNSLECPLQKSNPPFTLVTVGRLDEGKNHYLLLEALYKLNRKDVKLIIIGDGPLKSQLAMAIKKFRLEQQVELAGFIKNPFTCLANADIFLFASRHEGFPNVLVEALASGCAIISTDCPSGPREILAPESPISKQLSNEIECAEYGILIPVDNADLMAQTLNTLINNPNLLENYRQKALLRAKDFDKSIHLPQYERILKGMQ
jgi:N-acetylgalactosamine-N,N'-diacetylbacillosaminyl-diphospho-undecaprenol 4-alpha-N-acetylgalactosaminyltransferase